MNFVRVWRMGRTLPSALVVLVLLSAGATSANAAGQVCTGDPNSALPIAISSQGQSARGLYVLPARPARALVVFGHGYSYNDTAWIGHMMRAANLSGAVSVTMNYRGLIDLPRDSSGYERSRGWPVSAGAQDLIAAARYFDASCGPFDRIILLGVSMGGNSSGLTAAAQAKRIDGRPLFDYWIGVEGVYNLTELYNEATLVAPINSFAAQAKADIEAETGGTPAQVPQAYSDRTVVNQAAKIAGSGLRGIYVVHAVNDGEAAYNQAQEMTSNLRASGMPTDLYSVTRHAPGDLRTDTTLAQGAPGDTAGHEAEWSPHDIVLDTGFDLIPALLVRGEPPPCNRNFTVDGMANPQKTPDPSVRAPGCPGGERVTPGSSAGRSTTGSTTGCRSAPAVSVRLIRRHRRSVLSGSARAGRCGVRSARVTRVSIALARPIGGSGRCRFLKARGVLSGARSCAKPLFIRAHGTGRWRLKLRRRVPRGIYRLTVVAFESAGPRARVDRRVKLR
ncbi:MAG: hypothetical protein NVSMB25_02470 [Thermoleophilaceae bacterium]